MGRYCTPPKSKSIYEAATSGSTGGWAAGIGPSNPTNPNDPKGNDLWGQGLNAALGAVPIIGPALSIGGGLLGMAGPGTGFQGTDKGWDNLGSTLWGAAAGYGLGGLGAGAGGALKGIGGGLSGTGQGFQSGAGQYFGTNIIPGVQGSNPTALLGGQNAIPTSYGNMMQPTYGRLPAVTGTAALGAGLGAGGAAGAAGAAGAGTSMINQLANATMGTQGAEKAGFGMKEMLGAGLLGASALQKPPTLTTSEGTAREAIYQPNLVEARNMFRTMAFQDPSELVSPATDKYIEASLKQSRQANERAKETMLNTYSASGKVAGKSGAVDKQIARMDKEQLDRETDFITTTNEARYLSGIKLKVDAVQQYYNISYQEAMDLLASYGYVSETDKINYEAEMAAYNNLQQSAGMIGGNLMSGIM